MLLSHKTPLLYKRVSTFLREAQRPSAESSLTAENSLSDPRPSSSFKCSSISTISMTFLGAANAASRGRKTRAKRRFFGPSDWLC